MSLERTAVKQPAGNACQLGGKSFAFFGELSNWPYRAGEPADVVLELGGTVSYEVTPDLTYMVVGSSPVKGAPAKKLAQAQKSAEKLIALSEQSQKTGKPSACPSIIDEATFMQLVAIDVNGKSFAFFGGFDLFDGDAAAESLLHQMVKTVGGNLVEEVDQNLDYVVLGNIRRPGKSQAQAEAKKLQAAGRKVRCINEDRFLELVRIGAPLEKDGGATMEFGGFISHLHAIIDTAKLGRALKMLRAESFQLYVRKDEEALLGVVASQSTSDKIYSSWLNGQGNFGCATPDLQECMGLSGDICKHLLVLLVGLVRANKMDADTAYNWIEATRKKLPVRDIDLVADAFIQYKGAQLGEIDWRPTETVPEDYYAF